MSVLLDRLPGVRGRLRADAPLAAATWFKVGGPAEVLFRPEDVDDLRVMLHGRPADVPVTVLGVASNTLVRDGGVRGVVVRLGRGLAGVGRDGADGLVGGAGALCATVAQQAAKAGLGRLAFLSGIPGTVGGALRMNAGAYGGETKDILDWAEALDPNGRLHRLRVGDLGYAYRHCDLPTDWIFVRARFRGEPGAAGIVEEMAQIAATRATSQPVGAATGGSTFRNPPGQKAWELIDAAGCRGLCIGGAEMSEKHCNFMINTGMATAADLETLGETVRRRVKATSGITLEWEIRRIGEPLPIQVREACA